MINQTATGDNELLINLQGGDEWAFDQLYKLYSKRIYGNIYKMVKSQEIAEELLQDVFQKVWDRKTTLNPEKSFRSYLFTISKHIVYDFLNKETRRQEIYQHLITVSSELYSHVEEDLYLKENSTIIKNAIEQLPPQRKLVFTMCKIEGKTYEEISNILGISTSTINDHIVKATKFIKGRYNAEQAITSILVAAILQGW